MGKSFNLVAEGNSGHNNKTWMTIDSRLEPAHIKAQRTEAKEDCLLNVSIKHESHFSSILKAATMWPKRHFYRLPSTRSFTPLQTARNTR